MGIALRTSRKIAVLTLAAGALLATSAFAAPVTYTIDPDHSYPSFETDHMGFSIWRGKFNKTSGTITFDKEAKAGTVDVTIDATSVDTGNDTLNGHLNGENFLDTAKFPTAKFVGKLANFKGDQPTEVQGQLTLHGVTKPLTLKIVQFLCKPHPMRKKDACGADASATFNRKDFGITRGEGMFNLDTKLQISVEAVAAN